MPRYVREPRCIELEQFQFDNFSALVAELRDLGEFKYGLLKFRLPPEEKKLAEELFTDFKDPSPNSFFSQFGKIPLVYYLEQRVGKLATPSNKPAVFSVDLQQVVRDDQLGIGCKTVADFFKMASEERPYGFYGGSHQKAPDSFDGYDLSELKSVFWKACADGTTMEKPFLYAADIYPPTPPKVEYLGGPYSQVSSTSFFYQHLITAGM